MDILGTRQSKKVGCILSLPCLVQDKDDTAPLGQEPPHTHAQVATRRISQKHPPSIDASQHGKMFITKRLDKDDDGRSQLLELFAGEFEPRCLIPFCLRYTSEV